MAHPADIHTPPTQASPTGASGSERVLIVGTSETLARAGAAVCESRRLRALAVGTVLVGPDTGVSGSPVWSCGLPALGGLDQIEDLVRRSGAGVALLCLPAAMTALIGKTQRALERAGLTVRHLPLIEDIAAGLSDPGLRTAGAGVDPGCLFDRRPRGIDPVLVRGVVGGRRVLITGAGGSIGSELARICAAHDPSLLILMDRSDNALFEIDRQVRAAQPSVNRRVVLHDVVDAPRTLERLEELRPDIVFHAAAHKHVPLMEDHPAAAVNNNLFGTAASSGS